MTTGTFLRDLYERGELVIPAGAPDFAHESGDDADFADIDRAARIELAGKGPSLVVPILEWAANLLYSCSVCYGFRDLDAEKVAVMLAAKCPEDPPGSDAERAYSADLAFRFLPDLLRLSRGFSPGDPLVTALIDLGKQWPLSSIGIPEVDNDPSVDPLPFLDDLALRELYVDRVLCRNASGRLKIPRVARLARGAIGLHDRLAPEIALTLSALEVP